MLESDYQKYLREKIETIFPGSIVIKNDPSYIQGFPDLLVLYKNKWAILEVKKDISELNKVNSSVENQKFYIKKLNEMSFARFIFPQNEEEVLNELQQTFRP